MSLKILIVGAGAVGGYFGARLAAAGRDVTFLVRPNRAAALRAQGLQVKSPLGDLTLQPKLVIAEDLSGPFQLIFLSVKAYALEAAMKDFAPAVGPNSLILPVLNGMAHMARLEARFGRDALIGGACRIAVTLQDGVIRQLMPLQQIGYGELDGAESERVRAVDAAMQGVGFDASISSTTCRICGRSGCSWPASAAPTACCAVRSARSSPHLGARPRRWRFYRKLPMWRDPAAILHPTAS
jgi:2-dehydropantoate 2-reductase